MNKNKRLKQIKFHELMRSKSQIEIEFWKDEMEFHDEKLLKLKNMDEEFTT